MGWEQPTHKVTWHIDQVVTWQIENGVFPLSQHLWTPNLAGCLLIMNGPEKVTWYFNSGVAWQFENVIFLQPQVLWLPNLAGYILRLRGPLAQRQMTLLFRGHVKRLHFQFYLHFHIAYGLWDWLRMREHHLKNLQFTWHFPHLTNWKSYAKFFLVLSNSNWFFTSLICIPTVQKPICL